MQQQDSVVDAQTVEKCGCPGGALRWFYTLLPALSFASEIAERLTIAWDKTPKANGPSKTCKKIYGVFENHASFWTCLETLGEHERYAYEIIPKRMQCKAYWDIEYCVENSEQALRDARELLGQWILRLKGKIKELFGLDAKCCVLDGTRRVDEETMKFSAHVVVFNLAFEHNQSDAFVRLRSQIPSLYEVLQEEHALDYGPREEDTGAPDLCVWKDNQIFRCLSCSKRGGSTPLHFWDSPWNETRDPMDTFLTHFKEGHYDLVVGQQSEVATKKTRKRKKSRYDAQDEEEEAASSSDLESVSLMLQRYPQEIACIKQQIQILLNSWKNTNTRVDKLVRAKINLRFQCVNTEFRPCVFSREVHRSNTPIIWLDAPFNVNEGDLSSHYIVNYNCKSSECMCSGIIGEIFLNEETKRYEQRKVFPAILQGNRGPVRAQLRSEQAVLASSKKRCLMDMPCKSLRLTKAAAHASAAGSDANARGVDDRHQDAGYDDNPNHQDVGYDDNQDAGYEDDEQAFAEEEDMTASANGGDCLTRPRNLIDEKIAGFGWSLYELKTYGEHKTYKAVKAEMEKSICKINRPHVMFLSFTSGSEYHHYTYDNMAKKIKNTFYYKKATPEEAPTVARFFSAWTDDPGLRSYEHLRFDPSPDRSFTGPHDLNVWPGLKAEVAAVDGVDDAATIEELVGPIRNHVLKVLVDHSEAHCEWLIDWMASIVQRPDKKTQVPVVISGKQGVGKGIIFDFFREQVLGPGISAQIQNPAQDLFSRFANKHVDKIFLQIDEGEGMGKYADQMKNLITSNTINYEIKGLQPLTTANFINIVITTNHERPVLVETSDRRYVLFKASDFYLRNDEYYLNLAAHLKDSRVAKAFYKYLMQRDLTKYAFNFQSSRPLTEYYLQSRKGSIPVVQRFLSALINTKRYLNDGIAECSILLLFRDFTKFQECGKFQSSMTQSTFSMRLKGIPGIDKKTRQGSTFFYLHYAEIQKHLCENYEYDEDATMDSVSSYS